MMPPRVAGTDPEHVAEGRGGLGVPVPPPQHDAETLAQAGVLWSKPDRVAISLGGLAQPALPLEGQAEPPERLRVVRCERERLAVRRYRLAIARLLVQGVGEIAPHGGRREIARQRVAMHGLGGRRLALAALHRREVGARPLGVAD